MKTAFDKIAAVTLLDVGWRHLFCLRRAEKARVNRRR